LFIPRIKSGFIERKEFARFKEMDDDHSSTIDLAEFVRHREKLGLSAMTDSAAKELFRIIDKDHSGEIRFYELCAHCAEQLAVADDELDRRRQRPLEGKDDGHLVARRRRFRFSTDSHGARTTMTEDEVEDNDAAGSELPTLSHDGLRIAAPHGTKYERQWVGVLGGVSDLEREMIQGRQGKRPASKGGRGGKLLLSQGGTRLINFRRVDTRMQGKYEIPRSLKPLHANPSALTSTLVRTTDGSDEAFLSMGRVDIGDGTGDFPDTKYHHQKIKMLASPLFFTATTSKYWPRTSRRFDGREICGWMNPNIHPDLKAIRLGIPKKSGPSSLTKQRFHLYPSERVPFDEKSRYHKGWASYRAQERIR
jgi:hypothetical protein